MVGVAKDVLVGVGDYAFISWGRLSFAGLKGTLVILAFVVEARDIRVCKERGEIFCHHICALGTGKRTTLLNVVLLFVPMNMRTTSSIGVGRRCRTVHQNLIAVLEVSLIETRPSLVLQTVNAVVLGLRSATVCDFCGGYLHAGPI